MVLDVLAWTDELEARRARPRVTRFVVAIWDAARAAQRPRVKRKRLRLPSLN
jgi:hypothetical protein